MQEITLYVNKTDTVENLLEEASKYYKFDKYGTHKLRIIKMNEHKVLPGPSNDMLVEGMLCIHYY